MMTQSTLAIGAASLLAGTAGAATFTGGGFTIEPDGDSVQENIDISGLAAGFEFTGFELRIDFGGDRPNNSEFDLDLRALQRNFTDIPFLQFLDDNNFSFNYDANNFLTVVDDFQAPLVGGNYNNLRLTLFNDDPNSDLDVVSYELTLIPAPGAVAVAGLAGVAALRRRR